MSTRYRVALRATYSSDARQRAGLPSDQILAIVSDGAVVMRALEFARWAPLQRALKAEGYPYRKAEMDWGGKAPAYL